MTTNGSDFSKADLISSLEQSRTLGFLSPQPIDSQIQHSIDFLSLFPKHENKALDLGAGGGLPCLVWLNQNADVDITALDSMNKRTNFLQSVKDSNKSITDRFHILNGRAEGIAHNLEFREKFDIVVARGFGAPFITAECASGFIKPGGLLVVSGRPENEIQRWNQKALQQIGLSLKEVVDGQFSHAVVIQKTGKLNDQYPRSAALMKKKPLWS